jgi:glutathionylspermidine synthase
MERIPVEPRPDWQRRVESQGFLFYEGDDHSLWDESACYSLTEHDVEQLEAATRELHRMCLEAADTLVRDNALGLVGIPVFARAMVAESWKRREPSLYGRFDLAYDGQNPPKLLEYNADTPTSLLEAAVIQWYWFRDRFPDLDQFNSIHERLIARWRAIKHDLSRPVYFTCVEESVEDYMTVTYLRDTALQAAMENEFIAIDRVGWNAPRRLFVDERERAIGAIFKLYPWEWLFAEQFGTRLPGAPTRWIEPPWKAILSNKAILAVLWRLFPNSPYLVPASTTPLQGECIRKPYHAREGANIQTISRGQVQSETPGPYKGPYIYQERIPLRSFDGRHPVIGSWVVGDRECGIGIREDPTPIISGSSTFIPHIFTPGTGPDA